MVDFSKFGWVSIFNVVSSTEKMTNNQRRCLRTEIIELAISKHSGGQLKYVGDKMNGCDFVDSDGTRYECKSRQKMFSKSRNGCTKEIILKNFYRKSEPISHQTFDYMIMMDSTENSIGVVDYETAIKYSNVTDSIITTKIALNEIDYVAEKIVANNVTDFEQVLNDLILANI
jgi:hypothetical protein